MSDKILSTIENIRDDLQIFDDDLEKYEYIIDLGKELEPMDESLKDDSFLVEGCTSKVWLIPGIKQGIIKFEADSNSAIVKGLVSILLMIFNGSKPREIVSFDFEVLEKLKLSEIITPTRQNGVFHMVNKIKHYAKIYKDKE